MSCWCWSTEYTYPRSANLGTAESLSLPLRRSARDVTRIKARNHPNGADQLQSPWKTIPSTVLQRSGLRDQTPTSTLPASDPRGYQPRPVAHHSSISIPPPSPSPILMMMASTPKRRMSAQLRPRPHNNEKIVSNSLGRELSAETSSALPPEHKPQRRWKKTTTSLLNMSARPRLSALVIRT